MIRFACPGCAATFTVDDNKAGKAGKCPKCESEFTIPAADNPRPVSPPPPPPAADEAVEIKPCPKCGTKLTVMGSDLGLEVECPDCSTAFKAERPRGSRSGYSRSADDDRPSSRRRDDDDRDDDDRPRRPSRRRDYDDDEDDRPRRRRRSRRSEDAEASVNVPATMMMVLGGLGMLYALANLAGNLIGPGPNQNPFGMGGPNAQNNPAFKVFYVIGVCLPFVWSALTFFGGLKMKSLSGYTMAMIGAIFSMLPCSPCCLFGLPLGIWAVVVLMRDEVKDAFS